MFVGARHPSEPIFLHVTSNVKKAWLDKEMMLMLNTLTIKKNVKKRKIKIVTIRWLKDYEELSCDSVILFSGIYPKWKQGLSPHLCMFVHQNHSSIILKTQKIGIIEVFIDRWTDKQNVAWAYNAAPVEGSPDAGYGVKCSASSVEENWDTGFSVNKTSRHFVRNKPVTKQQMQHDPTNLRMLKQSHSSRRKE